MADLISVSPEKYIELFVPVAEPSQLPAASSDDVETHGNAPCTVPVVDWAQSLGSETCQFLLALRVSRFHLFDVKLPQVTDSYEDKYIKPVIDIANRDFFDHGDLPKLDFSSSKHDQWTVFNIGFNVGDDSDPSSKQQWCSRCSRSERGDKDTDWSKWKKSFCLVIFMSPGSLNRVEFLTRRDQHITLSTHTNKMVQYVWHLLLVTGAPYAMITDELASVVIDYYHIGKPYKRLPLEVYGTDNLSIKMALGTFVFLEGYHAGLSMTDGFIEETYLHGPQDDPGRFCRSLTDALEQEHCDVDLCTALMAHPDSDSWQSFLEWKSTVQSRASASPLEPGMVLSASCNAFFRCRAKWRSPVDPCPLPEDTLQSIMSYNKRPRNAKISDIMTLGQSFTFKIVEAKRTGPNSYSQVFFGTVDDCPELLCLKLYDARLFPVNVDTDKPIDRMVFAEDIIRREEAAYDRLRDLQGRLVPHCYGFHSFRLTENIEVYGLLMEAIHGPSLRDYDISNMSKEAQINFVIRMRHAEKAMTYNGVHQTDWHAAQIICPELTDDERDRHCDTPKIIMIDFGFAIQWMEEHNGTPSLRCMEFDSLPSKLATQTNIPVDIIDENWEDLTEPEY